MHWSVTIFMHHYIRIVSANMVHYVQKPKAYHASAITYAQSMHACQNPRFGNHSWNFVVIHNKDIWNHSLHVNLSHPSGWSCFSLSKSTHWLKMIFLFIDLRQPISWSWFSWSESTHCLRMIFSFIDLRQLISWSWSSCVDLNQPIG